MVWLERDHLKQVEISRKTAWWPADVIGDVSHVTDLAGFRLDLSLNAS